MDKKNNISPISDSSADSVVNSSLRVRVLEYRAKHRLTQRQFAKLADISRTTIQKIERGAACTQISQIKAMALINDHLL